MNKLHQLIHAFGKSDAIINHSAKRVAIFFLAFTSMEMEPSIMSDLVSFI
jgi:hypothetical protein